jgi:glycosyltransferase involved in cell wall biosynthesis
MKLIFVSIGMPDMAAKRGGLYADLLYGLADMGYDITVLAPALEDGFSGMRQEGDCRVVRVPMKPFMGNYTFWQKGTRILRMNGLYKDAYRKYLKEEKFDVVMMATPPATLVDVVKMIKQLSGAKFYLMLRDIHPECLNRKEIPERFMKRTDVYDECKRPYGVNIFAEKLLYYKSQSLYKIADWIGCMSPENQKFLKHIAPYVKDESNVLLPNWYKGNEATELKNEAELRTKYGLTNKFIAIFGGTIGEAQAVWNIATLAKHNLNKKDVVFLVVGKGVKKAILQEMAQKDNLTNMLFVNYMPKEDYEQILQLADVGLISLDEKYTVPTCPSKIIGYMALKKPVLAMINKGSDYGEFYMDKPGCGFWSADLDYETMFANFDRLYTDAALRKQMGQAGYDYYKTHFTVEVIRRELDAQIKRSFT